VHQNGLDTPYKKRTMSMGEVARPKESQMRVVDRSVVDKEDVRRMSEMQFKKLGVRLVDRNALTLECIGCGHTWTPELDSDGKLGFDYWLCPAQCNW